MNKNLKKFLKELKQAGYNEVSYEEENNVIDFSKCKKRVMKLEDIDEEEYGIKGTKFILGDDFNFSCIGIYKIDIKAGNHCKINVRNGEASILAGNNCNITLESGISLIIGDMNYLEAVSINEIEFGNNNHIEIEELINSSIGGDNNKILIRDTMEEFGLEKMEMNLSGSGNNVKIRKFSMNTK